MLNIQSICQKCSHLKLAYIKEKDIDNSTYIKDFLICDMISKKLKNSININFYHYILENETIDNTTPFKIIPLPFDCSYFLEHTLYNESI